jgi:signal transduction histidine kinase
MAYAAHIKVVAQRRGAGAVQGAVPVVVRGLCVRRDRDRRAGAGRGDEHRRGQSVHPQRLEAYVNPGISHAGEAAVAKIASLVVKVGALAFILFLPTQYALDLQLLGGVWILQTFPALVFGLFTRWFRADAVVDRCDRGWGVALISISGLLLNLSEHRVADAKLQLLARQVVRFQEDERAHLARELHDGATQTIVSAKLLVESAVDQLEREHGAAPPALARAVAGLKQTLDDVRRISHRLRPAMLDELGLPAALELLAREAYDAGLVQVDVQVLGEAVALPDEVKTALFRVAQEALANIAKHANASQVDIDLNFEPDGIALRISDNGSGFEADQVQLDPRRGIGLRNMRERLGSIGGRFEVRAAPGAGTVLEATVPVEAVHRFGKAT